MVVSAAGGRAAALLFAGPIVWWIDKPHPEVFESALRKAGVSAAEAVHVGDGYESDVVGAANAGLHAIYLTRQGATDAPEATAVVRTLGEVPHHVARLG